MGNDSLKAAKAAKNDELHAIPRIGREMNAYRGYDATEVPYTAAIPSDYGGVRGVPVSFLDRYCPEQFEILGITDRQNTSGLRTKKHTGADSPGHNDLNARSVIKEGGRYVPTYARLLIRKKKQSSRARPAAVGRARA